MHRYEHVGACGRIHTHLSVGAGIVLRVDPAEPRTIPHGSTVLLEPGDVLVTSAAYEHPELVELEAEVVTRPDVAPGRPPRARIHWPCCESLAGKGPAPGDPRRLARPQLTASDHPRSEASAMPP